MLIKLRPGDLALDRPTPFSIYSVERQLLLREGQVVTSESLLDRLYRAGHREEAASVGKPGGHAAVKAQPVGAGEKNQLLFGTAHLEGNSAAAVPSLSDRSAALPNLGDKIEFFHLTPAGAKEALRVELAGVVSGHALIVRQAPGEDALSLTAGVRYDARLFTGARLFRFATELLVESVGPFGCHFLQYPESVVRAFVRKHQRVPTSLPGKLRSGEYQRPAANVTIENISAIGAMVSAREDLLTVGQRAQLSMNLSLSTDSRVRPVTVFVEVRNRRPEGDQFSYGLEFVQMPDEVRRDIKDFVLDSMALL